MTTYRTGNNWGVTIVREAHDDPCPASVDGRCAESGEIHPKCKPGQCRYDQTGARRGQLVAVVVNGDRDLAERICELLNAPTPDVPYTHGAAEALAEVRRRLTYDDGVVYPADAQMLRDAAAELGVGLAALDLPDAGKAHPGEKWWWPTECAQCDQPIGPWNPDDVGSEMTHIVSGGGPDWGANRDHPPPLAVAYCAECNLRMMPGTRHPHPLTPVPATSRRHAPETAPSATETAQEPSAGGSGRSEAHSGAEAIMRRLVGVLSALTGTDPCHFDHGNCQAHFAGKVDGQCSNARARDLLAELGREWPFTDPDRRGQNFPEWWGRKYPAKTTNPPPARRDGPAHGTGR